MALKTFLTVFVLLATGNKEQPLEEKGSGNTPNACSGSRGDALLPAIVGSHFAKG